MRLAILALALAAAVAGPAAADEPRHAAYVDVLGKGGLWGLGYDYAFARRFTAGAVGSYYVLGGDHHMTLAPYVGVYPVGAGRHRWFVQAGPQLARTRTPSPVPGWGGHAETALAVETSSGYEYRRGVLVRVYAMLSAGERVLPWLGVSMGWSR